MLVHLHDGVGVIQPDVLAAIQGSHDNVVVWLQIQYGGRSMVQYFGPSPQLSQQSLLVHCSNAHEEMSRFHISIRGFWKLRDDRLVFVVGIGLDAHSTIIV